MFKLDSRSRLSKKKHLKTEGVILGSTKIKECDKLVYIYSKDFGKIRTLAKGSLKTSSKFTGLIETLNVCQLELYQGPGNLLITEVRTIKTHKILRENLKKIQTGILITKITSLLTLESETLPEIYHLLVESIAAIEESEKELIILTHYIVKLFDILGLLPNYKDEHTSSKLSMKEKRLIQFIRNNPLSQSLRIRLEPEEEAQLKNLLQNMVAMETNNQIKIP